jgi:hypothetical protein
METIFAVCAAVGGTLIVLQFLMTLFGLGGDHDVGGDAGHDFGGHDVAGHDAAGHHEAGHGNESSWFFGIFTFKTLSAAFAFFGLTGMATGHWELEPAPRVALAVAAGLAALFFVAWIMGLLAKLNLDGTLRIERAVGSRGTVYLSIPGNKAGVGKVHVSLYNRMVEYKAVTAQEALPTGAKVVVVSIIGPDTVEVASALEPERASHV